ncbi:MAG TPA: plasmid maintenance protein CcdB [Gammaproteobacteria bacterium]|nr:plasmid maintenance protein CcdB [Gammaproteobacteria bacterium]
MSQYTLYENPNADAEHAYPYFMDVQNSLLSALDSRVVIPMTLQENIADAIIADLCPPLVFDGKTYRLLTYQMTTVPVSALQYPIDSLDHMHEEIQAALAFLVANA